MRKTNRFGVVALAVAVGTLAVGLAGCGKKEPERPSLTVRLSATSPDGEPLAGVSVEAQGKAQGTTDAKGELAFQLTADVGDEFTTTARLDRPGLQFKPWQQSQVVRKWDAARPETLEYRLEAKLEPAALSAQVELDAGGAPAQGAEVRIDGKPAKLGEGGRLEVDLEGRMSRPAKVSVRLKDYEPFEEATTLRAGETFVARLAKIGVVYGKVVVAYEAMERMVPVPGADVTVGGKPVGKTDKAGSVRYQVPEKEAPVEVKKDDFLPTPATGKVPGRRAAQVLVSLVPREPPAYRVALASAKSAAPGDAEVEGALAEIDDKLADHLFSHACFQKAESEKAADAVVSVTAGRAEGGLLLSVRVAWVKGKTIGGFAEAGKFTRVNSLAESVAGKIVEVFPFEGHVLGFEEDRVITSLGTGKDRGVKKGDGVALYHWDGKTPVKLAALGKAVVRRVDPEFSRVELAKGASKPAVGDKAVLLPRAAEAAFDSAVSLTVKAGRAGSERPLTDVNVYRDGLWIGTTSASGELKVPVSSGEKHVFLFVKGGIKPYREEIKVDPAAGGKTIVLPEVTARLTLESEPSGARVRVDDEEVGTTPLETDVLMGFHRVVVDAGGDWRAYDKVMEFTTPEASLTGSRRIVLQKDALKQSESLLDRGDVNGAIGVLAKVEAGHPDYSAARHRLAGLYLDEKKDPAKAILEYQRVLELPENRELVNKRFAVTFLNLGRAYYQTGTPDGYRKAIEQLLIARDNKRFFPKDQHDQATHDTHYFLALASHKLYHAAGSDGLLQETSKRWKDYFDYFPQALQADPEVKQARASAEQYYEEIKKKLKEVE
jgi:tetratricopeptide (TPR) repeat protein